MDSNSINSGTRSLLPVRGVAPALIYVQDIGTSGTLPDNAYFRVNLVTGMLTPVAAGQFLRWSPQHDRFCTADMRQLETYGKDRALYVSPLEIGSPKSDNVKDIVHGMVWVTGVDWR